MFRDISANSASTLTIVRYDSEYVYRYAHKCTYTYTCRRSRSRPSPCSRICRYPRCVLQRNSANHSRAYSDACHNERRATFCFGPVGRKYRPFWIFNFQRSSKPLRGPLLPRRFLSPFLFLLVPVPVPVAPSSPFPFVLSRVYERKSLHDMTRVSSSRKFRKNFWKNRYRSGVNVHRGIERKFDAFSQGIPPELGAATRYANIVM